MLTLPELQAGMRRALLGGDDAVAALVAGDGLAPAARLAIYRHHVQTTLTEALQATYPGVARLVDPRFFAYAAAAYIDARPPRRPCLAEYGEDLADFLAGFAPCRHLAWLPDVARLEWALNAALQADDPRPLDLDGLRAVADADRGRLRFSLDPSLTLLESPWPLDRIWRLAQPDADPDATVDLDAGGVRLEIRRHGDEATFRTLDPGPFALRRALRDGHPLPVAAAAAFAADGALDLAAALQALLDENLLTGFAVVSAGHEGLS
jgi:hypothetical protein